MDANMLDTVQKILWATSFIAVGGTVALMFVLVFAPSLFGSRTIQKQLNGIRQQLEHVSRQLERIAGKLETDGDKTGSSRPPDSGQER